VAAFGAGVLLGALARQPRPRLASGTVAAAPAEDPAIGIGQGGMDFGMYDPGPFGVEDYAEHATRHPASFPRLWCPHCYGSGCRHCHGIGEVAP
jgi:hypothetical protein